jgi:cell wall-associated NlpC family hydrolase
MKFFKVNSLLLVVLLFIFSCQNDQIEEIKQLEKFIPDSRVEIFDVDTEDGKTIVKTSNKTVFEKAQKIAQDKIEIKFLPEKEFSTPYGVINLSVANIRKETRHGSTLITQGTMGMPVKIYEKKGSWCRIQTPDNYIGWVDGSGVHPMKEKEYKNWRTDDKIIFTDYTGFVYQSADSEEEVISDIVLGNILRLKGLEKGLYKVEFPDGRSGYVKSSQSEVFSKWLDKVDLNSKSLIKLAKKFLGSPYLWGGTSYKAMDCSGFVKTVFAMHGVILQRDASQQALYGKEISLEDNFSHLQPGDLLFFGRDHITHVGMYIGNMEFIHDAGRVRINSLDEKAENFSGYRKSSIKIARRIIGYTDSEGISTYATNEYYKLQRGKL